MRYPSKPKLLGFFDMPGVDFTRQETRDVTIPLPSPASTYISGYKVEGSEEKPGLDGSLSCHLSSAVADVATLYYVGLGIPKMAYWTTRNT